MLIYLKKFLISQLSKTKTFYIKDENSFSLKKLIVDDNPYQKFIFVAEAIDSWRIIPRAFLGVYMYLLYFTTFWFMDLPEPSFEQTGLISIVVGAGAAWFGLYTNSHKPDGNKGKD